MTFGEILSKAAVNTLLGMGTVFFMLVLIIAVISLFRFIPDSKKETEEEPAQTTAAGEPEAMQSAAPGSPEDPLLVPVIMAALMAAMGEEGSAAAIADGTCPYTVRSIRRR